MLPSLFLRQRPPSGLLAGRWGFLKPVASLMSLVLAVLAMGVIVQHYLDVDMLRAYIEGLGIWAPLIFVALAAIKNILFIPVLPIVVLISSGALIFGDLFGALYSWLGISIGACLAFLAGRYWAGNVAARFKYSRWKALDRSISSHGFLAIVGLRLVLFTSTAFNYASGLTSLRMKDYLLGTLIGLVPRTFLLSFISESFTEASIFEALLTYPYSLLWLVLVLSWIVGLGLLTCLVKHFGPNA
jgi:uncharacterized membrane protein YdjX (TVP38/TMEM64 family)